jgi:Family of unknown function (DUF5681)
VSKESSNPGWFPKGRSGNLNGRPKGSRVPKASAFEVLVDKTFTVTDRGGGTREITMEEALEQRTFQDALAGKPMAVREVMKWIKKRDAWLEKHGPKAEPTPLLISHNPDNADAALVLLGIAAPDPARADFRVERAQLLLEPWAVQAALRRRRGVQRLTKSELSEVRRSTRDADTLRWPQGLEDDVPGR